MTISYVVGDATRPAGDGPKIVVHVCNDEGKWGAGFVLALSRRWSTPESEYRAWSRGERPSDGPFALGRVQFVEAEPGTWVANLVGQRGVGWKAGVPPVRYDAVRAGLAKVAEFAIGRSAAVHMPRIGCGLGGGRWDEVSRIIESEILARGVPVTVYDFGGVR